MKHKANLIGIIAVGTIAMQMSIPVVAHASTQYDPTTISIIGETSLHPQHVVANDPWSGRPTSWVPVYYLQESLRSVGVETTWNGSTLNTFATPNGWSTNVSGTVSGNLPSGEMQFSINQNILLRAPKLVEKDPASGLKTTYVPVYYADLFLRQRIGIVATWDGSTWSLSSQPSYTPPTSISSVLIASNGVGASMYYVPQTTETVSVTQQILSWLQSATKTTSIDLPPSTPGLVSAGYDGPSQLFITLADRSQITINPAWAMTGSQGRSQVNYDPNVVEYVDGNQIVYLNSPQLYTWLKDDQWKTEFTMKIN